MPDSPNSSAGTGSSSGWVRADGLGLPGPGYSSRTPGGPQGPDFGQHEDPEARQRFLEEARTAATLDHPYLCPVYDAGEIDGQPYLTMAYIEGQSLAALIGDDGLAATPGRGAGGQARPGLAGGAHEKVIHRDLKPANVMIKTAGQRREPVIVDFGLARRENPEEQRLTRSGQVMGTLGYMAPEQIRGDLEGDRAGLRHLRAGSDPLRVADRPAAVQRFGLAVAGQILTQAPLPPSTHRSNLDPALEAICLKAMAKAIGDRYGSMAELAAPALTAFLQKPAAGATSTGSPGWQILPTPTHRRALAARPAAALWSLISSLSSADKQSKPSVLPAPQPTVSQLNTQAPLRVADHRRGLSADAVFRCAHERCYNNKGQANKEAERSSDSRKRTPMPRTSIRSHKSRRVSPNQKKLLDTSRRRRR